MTMEVTILLKIRKVIVTPTGAVAEVRTKTVKTIPTHQIVALKDIAGSKNADSNKRRKDSCNKSNSNTTCNNAGGFRPCKCLYW